MNYKNGAVTGVTIAKGATVNKKAVFDSRHNAIFETFEEFSKTWEKYTEKQLKQNRYGNGNERNQRI